MRASVVFFLLSIIALLDPMASQARLSGRYLFEQYTEREGLPNNTVNSVNQDQDGVLWVATRAGLVSYDGQNWILQTPADGIMEKSYTHLAQGPDGMIWAVAQRPPFRVQYRQGSRWEHLSEAKFPVASANASIFLVERWQNNTTIVVLGETDGNLAFWYDDQWHRAGQFDQLARQRAHCWWRDSLLVGTEEGLLTVDPTEGEIRECHFPGLPPGTINALTVDPLTGHLWLVGSNWIGKVVNGDFQLLAQDLNLAQDQIWYKTNALADRTGGLYFGGISMAYHFDPVRGLAELNVASGRLANGATWFFRDREGLVWISGLRGLSKLVSRRFVGLDREQGLFADEVTAVLEDSRGRIILGHEGGLTILDPEPRHLSFHLPPGKLCRVMDLVEDDQGVIWVATDGQGVAKINLQENMTWLGPAQGIPLRTFAILCPDPDQIWIAHNSGLVLGDGETFLPVELPLNDYGRPHYVRRLYLTRDGSLFLATGSGGVLPLKNGSVQANILQQPGFNNSTFAVLELAENEFWVGTEGGLFALEGGGLVKTESPNPVLDRPIYSISRDGQNRVWFGTDHGVYIWDGQNLVNYSIEDGLVGSEINRAGFQLDSKGQFWVGTDRGVSIYRPDLDLPPLAAPRVLIEGYDVDGHFLSSDQTLQLNSPPHTLTIHFRGLSFADEKQTGIRTWLENYETGWNQLSDRLISQVRYTNLPAGQYRFHVQMQNRDGTTSPVVVSPELKIQPFLWQRWYLQLLMIVVVVVVGYTLVSFWEGKRYARRLEEEVLARTRQLEESEYRVRAESQRLGATLSSILDGVVAVDRDNIVKICNPAAEAILDCQSEQIIGQPLAQVFPLLDEKLKEDESTHTMAGSRGRLECPRRGNIILEISTSPINEGSGVSLGHVVAFSDVTDKLRLERELIRSQKLESLGLLAGGIAHDFNNLLTVILGNLDLIKMISPTLTENDQESLGLAIQASVRAQALTEQLVTFARGGTPSRRLTHLPEILQQSVALSLSGRSTQCHLEIPDNLWQAYVDPSQMSQVFSNLLINAAQAVGEDGVIRVGACNLESAPFPPAEGPWIRLDFVDNGEGISEARLSRIFDPYFTTKSTGSGLGLATVHSIVTRHGGHVQVDSEVGVGTTFSILLPKGIGVAPTPAQKPEPIIPQGGKVLVLEDEAGIRSLLSNFLQKMEMTVVFSEMGTETVALYREAQAEGEPFDLVITDLIIPGGMGGKKAMALILELDPQARGIVISGYSHENVLSNYEDHGYKGALGKPFDFEDLARVVGQVMCG